MFEYQIYKNRNKTEAKSNQNAFFEWLKSMGLDLEGFDISVRSDETWKGKPITYFITSYGFYQVQGGWVVYIAYRGDILNVVRQHTWKWDGKKADVSSYSFNKFANI